MTLEEIQAQNRASIEKVRSALKQLLHVAKGLQSSACQTCASPLVVLIDGRASGDCFAYFQTSKGQFQDAGTIPKGAPIHLSLCMACGQVQNWKPRTFEDIVEAIQKEHEG